MTYLIKNQLIKGYFRSHVPTLNYFKVMRQLLTASLMAQYLNLVIK